MILSTKNKHQEDLKFFTIFDTKTNSYGPPALSKNQFTMVREITQLLKDPAQSKNQLVSNSEDFQLFEIGSYDQQTGNIEKWTPKHIANLHQLKADLA